MLDTQKSVTRFEVIEEALSWQNTPYKHQASSKGHGCDCLGLIRGVYGAFWQAPTNVPAYSPDWAEVGGRETLAEAAQFYLVPKPICTRQPGDILLFRYRAHFPAKHAGILLEDNQFLHAQHGGTVARASLGEWWQRRIAFVFAFPTDDVAQK